MDSDEEIWSYTTKKKRKNTKKDEGEICNESKRYRRTQSKATIELGNSRIPLNENVKENVIQKTKRVASNLGHLRPEKARTLPKTACAIKDNKSSHRIDLVDLTFSESNQELTASNRAPSCQRPEEVSHLHSEQHTHHEEVLSKSTVEVIEQMPFDEADLFDRIFSENNENLPESEQKAVRSSPLVECVQESHVQQTCDKNACSVDKPPDSTEQAEENELFTFSQGDLFDSTFSENDGELSESKIVANHSSALPVNNQRISNSSSGDSPCPGQVLPENSEVFSEKCFDDEDDPIDLTLSENDEDLFDPQAVSSSSPREDRERSNASPVNKVLYDGRLCSEEGVAENRGHVEGKECFDRPDPIDLTFSENSEELVAPEPPSKLLSSPRGDASSSVLDVSKNRLQSTLFKFFSSKSNSSTRVAPREASSSKALLASKANPSKAAWDKMFAKASEKNEGYYDRVFREAGVKPAGEPKCAFCKRIPETTFCVDAFRNGAIPGMTSYFLSHFHSDHYAGLNRHFDQPIFCSKVTANLVVRMLAVSRQWVNALPLNEMCVIKGVKVTLLDANHCPGSVMFLFETASGRRYLHSGDCRYTPTFLPLPPIDILFLDTTYCRPEYAFPPQEAVISEAIKLARRDALFVCGSYTLGKERLFLALSHVLNASIYVSKQKRIVLDCLEDKDLVQRLKTDPALCQIHVVPMGHLKEQLIRQRLASAPRYSRVIALRPTGWTHSSKQSPVHLQWERGPVSFYGVAYSEHSSFAELKEFVEQVRPGRVVATVGSQASVKHWFQEWLASR